LRSPFDKGYPKGGGLNMNRVNLTHEQIEDLLENVLEVPKMNSWKGEKIQFCCPVHH